MAIAFSWLHIGPPLAMLFQIQLWFSSFLFAGPPTPHHLAPAQCTASQHFSPKVNWLNICSKLPETVLPEHTADVRLYLSGKVDLRKMVWLEVQCNANHNISRKSTAPHRQGLKSIVQGPP